MNNAVSGRRFAAALLPRLFEKNPRSHHKGATGRIRTGDQRLPALYIGTYCNTYQYVYDVFGVYYGPGMYCGMY